MTFAWTTRHTKLTLLAIGTLLFGGFWASHTVRNIDRCIAYSGVVSHVLQAYATDHDGHLPSSVNELLQTGYLFANNNGQLRVAERFGHAPFDGVSFFDVAWGTTPEETDEHGFIAGKNRFLIVPAEDSICDPNWCNGTSAQVAKAMKSTTTRPRG